MYISELVLVNYRNFKKSKFIFDKDINTIIGENGTGKTNLFRAIRLLLDDEMLFRAYKMGVDDFNHEVDDWRGHWIIINLTFREISHDESIQSIFIHEAGVLEDAVSEATYNLIFRPGLSKRIELSKLISGDKDGLAKLRNSITIDDYEVVFTGKSHGDFYDENIYKKVVGDFNKVEFPRTIDSHTVGWIIPKQISLSKDISFTFIKALRDVVSDFNGNKKNPLVELLELKSETLTDSDYSEIINSVVSLNSNIEMLPDVKDVSGGIHSTLREAVGEAFSPTVLSIKSKLPEKPAELLKSLTLSISEGSVNFEGKITDMSLGGANLLFLILKILKYKYLINKGKVANFILIEEPEAHLHTHIQKALFANLDFENTQIIYSTHSTQISESSKVSKVNIISKKEGEHCVDVCQPSHGLNSKDITKLERYLDAKRSNLLFAKKIILVEGDAEEIIIPAMFKRYFGISLDELGVSLVNVGSTGFQNIANIFDEKRLRRRCAIITDMDKSFYKKIHKKDLKTIKSKKRKALRSEKIGKERAELLDKYCDSNDFVKPFYSKYTFEVDFIIYDNQEYIIDSLSEIYSHKKKIKDVTSDLRSLDHEIFGDRVLGVAKYAGKGWLALALSEKINHEVSIPSYILDALSFAIGKFSDVVLLVVLEHRKKFYLNKNDSYQRICLEEIICKLRNGSKIDRKDILARYENVFGAGASLLRMI